MNNNFLPSLSNKRKLTEQQQNFLSALAVQAKGDINKALDMAGYKETSYYNVINNLKDEIVEVATKILAKSAPQASQKLVEILESDDPIPQVNAKLQAAQTLLDRVGVAKRDKLDITHTSASGIFLLPTKKELIELIRLKQIGRIRARALYNAGYKNLNIINDVTVIRLSQVPQIGKSIAQNIKEQLKDFESDDSDIR